MGRNAHIKIERKQGLKISIFPSLSEWIWKKKYCVPLKIEAKRITKARVNALRVEYSYFKKNNTNNIGEAALINLAIKKKRNDFFPRYDSLPNSNFYIASPCDNNILAFAGSPSFLYGG